MVMQPALPRTSFVDVTTRRLREPLVIWKSANAESAGFLDSEVFCCPQVYERDDTYTSESRIERADRYGGTGTGLNGGSGRCSITPGGLQTKGVGVTPLVATNADGIHGSGVVYLMEACVEATYGAIYSSCLPFSATPVLALILTGGQYVASSKFDPPTTRRRTLAIRPFVTRPAHFMRNMLFRDSVGKMGVEGWSRDAMRTAEAMRTLAEHLQHTLDLSISAADEVATIDAGLREMARRFAFQSAASFAKRLPHGTLSCSNIALSGSFLDYGLSNYVASYRRHAWPSHWLDPWNEHLALSQTLTRLRQQLEKYYPMVRGTGAVSAEALSALYRKHFNSRLAVEMAKMGGLTEDMAEECPPHLLENLLRTTRSIWRRGANESYLTQYPGNIEEDQSHRPPRAIGRFDLNSILELSTRALDADIMETTLAPSLTDPKLRTDYIATTMDIRQWLQSRTGHSNQNVLRYLAVQSQRKNSSLYFLGRTSNGSHAAFSKLESENDLAGAASLIDHLVKQGLTILSDLNPELPGKSGFEQLNELAKIAEAGNDWQQTTKALNRRGADIRQL
jgi:hypothetical protein